MSQQVTILGSTGSIGASSLDVISRHPEDFKIFALTANVAYQTLADQCAKYNPSYAVVMKQNIAQKLTSLLRSKGCNTQVLCGAEDLILVAQESTVDSVIAGIVGGIGLRSTMAAVESGKKVLLANKEALVMAGRLFKQAVLRSGCTLLPIDSEHNAIFQCLSGEKNTEDVKKIIITASGGPFLNHSISDLKRVSVKEALNHPNWKMGSKITIDSATLVNKCLELIEAKYLFDLDEEYFDLVVHPQSIIHSIVTYIDGSSICHMSCPNMKIPIAHALSDINLSLIHISEPTRPY